MPFTHPLYGGLSTNAEIAITGKPYHGPNKSFGVNFRVGSNDIATTQDSSSWSIESSSIRRFTGFGRKRSDTVTTSEWMRFLLSKYLRGQLLVGRFDHRIPVGNITHLEVVGEVALLKVALYNVSTAPSYNHQPPPAYPSAPYPNVVHQNTTTTTTYQTPYPNQNAYPNAPPVYPTIPQSYNPQSPNPNARVSSP
uniref:Galectin domain-containing protein n=1 Tax=Ditylenchus dipsaci TaxID=166011 RepID=A0A915D9B2_9BILA